MKECTGARPPVYSILYQSSLPRRGDDFLLYKEIAPKDKLQKTSLYSERNSRYSEKNYRYSERKSDYSERNQDSDRLLSEGKENGSLERFPFTFLRKVRDSNPRYPKGVYRISSPARSITLPTFLRCFADAKVGINYETAKLFGKFFGFLFSNL